MTGKKYDKPLHIDMAFGEALERFAKTNVNDLPESVRLRQGRTGCAKPPAGKREAKDEAGPRRNRMRGAAIIKQD